jgi:ABC-2 type transport system ATP-binding protein
MDHGRVIALGTPVELVASLNADQMVEFSVRGELGERSLVDLPGVRSARRRNGDYLLSVSDIGVALPSLLAALEREHVKLVSLATHQPTLEDVFVSLTGRMLRDG